MSVSIERAGGGDLPEILSLLRNCGLPQEGLEDHLETALVARSGGRIVGCAALETYPPAALLRSVAVERDRRGKGLGLRLSEAALSLARRLGVREVYLLTETADGLFARLGFEPVSRGEVPSPVRESVEFVSACPASARVMALRL
ncbi:Amino-acid acetyltransferase [Rubrobacter xylanophilus DSM 9941]|uniref:arsenic resistance N-acetyltransferase ArsN2 n=1 Tax=Rubrobacter xylanophilus TaxID=49319 RepID=UPI001C640576|nr:arsenic resistance N-acetyltransferase ArsN2 [Rubrobacter xylanophilus]QYJ15910.1 Amino-acid acetyltransferase [Rubrobacter xylanophilus DSM 9941]